MSFSINVPLHQYQYWFYFDATGTISLVFFASLQPAAIIMPTTVTPPAANAMAILDGLARKSSAWCQNGFVVSALKITREAGYVETLVDATVVVNSVRILRSCVMSYRPGMEVFMMA